MFDEPDHQRPNPVSLEEPAEKFDPIEGVIEEIRRIRSDSCEAWGFGASIGAPVQTSCHVQEKSEAELGQLWSNLFFSAPTGSAGPPRALVVTSARRGDGATQIAAALALIGADANRELRIALVDFNLRTPCVAKLLGINAEPGLTDVVEGRASLESAMRAVSLRNGTLYVLPAGPIADRPLALLKSRHVKSLMARLQEGFDHVILDTASANLYPDAQIVGSMAGGVIVVIRAGQTPRETVGEVKKRLDLAGVHCFGVVLNQRTDPIPDLVYRMT